MSLQAPLLAVRSAPRVLRSRVATSVAASTAGRASAPRYAACFSTSIPRRGESAVAQAMATARQNVANGKRSPQAKEGEDGTRMLMFGKPGSGKGTLSGRLVKEYDINFISTGDLLRQEIAAKSEIGKKAEEIVASGGLVSDELMLEMVMGELEHHHGQSFILDGFPRTLKQGEMLNRVLQEQGRPLNLIVNLGVPDSVILDRIAARWIHLPSGRTYNDDFNPPKVKGQDDVTGEPLSKRPDDTPEVFSKRLKSYYKSTAPLLEYFAHEYPDTLHSLAGNTSDEIWPKLKIVVDEVGLETRFEHVYKHADDLRDNKKVDTGKGSHVKQP